MITNKKKEKIGFDLDGVIFYEYPDSWFKNLMWRIAPTWWSTFIHSDPDRTSIKVPEGSYIITARPAGEWIATVEQLHTWKIDATLCINPDRHSPDKMKGVMWKIKKINELGITKFYEDDNDTIQLLKVATKAKIIKVNNGTISYQDYRD